MSEIREAGEHPEGTLPADPHGLLRDHWNEFAEKYNSGPGKTTPTLVNTMLRDFQASAPIGEALLDLACGAGRTTAMVAGRCAPGGRVVGVDLSPKMIEAAQSSRPHPQAEFVVASADALPFENASFDHVFCNLGLMLFPNASDALSESARVLRPGGSLRATVWGRPEHTTVMSLLPTVAESLGIELPRPPRSNFYLGQPDQLKAVATGSGLELRSWHYQPLRFPYPDGEAACEAMGISGNQPSLSMRLVKPADRARLIRACGEEATRRLEAGNGALVLDVLIAEFT